MIFSEVLVLHYNQRITNHSDSRQSAIMLRKFSDGEHLYLYTLFCKMWKIYINLCWACQIYWKMYFVLSINFQCQIHSECESP